MKRKINKSLLQKYKYQLDVKDDVKIDIIFFCVKTYKYLLNNMYKNKNMALI